MRQQLQPGLTVTGELEFIERHIKRGTAVYVEFWVHRSHTTVTCHHSPIARVAARWANGDTDLVRCAPESELSGSS